MREILFRGKCKDTGKWCEGQYIHLHKSTYCFKEDYDRHPDNDIHQIVYEIMSDWGLPNRHFRVDVLPETVGQYTGLTDKNGKKIFEGDVLNCITSDFDGSEKYVYNFKITDITDFEQMGFLDFCNEIEIISNIHDNSELLKEGTDNGKIC